MLEPAQLGHIERWQQVRRNRHAEADVAVTEACLRRRAIRFEVEIPPSELLAPGVTAIVTFASSAKRRHVHGLFRSRQSVPDCPVHLQRARHSFPDDLQGAAPVGVGAPEVMDGVGLEGVLEHEEARADFDVGGDSPGWFRTRPQRVRING